MSALRPDHALLSLDRSRPVDKKTEGQKIIDPHEEAVPRGKVVDLMAALRKSISDAPAKPKVKTGAPSRQNGFDEVATHLAAAVGRLVRPRSAKPLGAQLAVPSEDARELGRFLG
jgi:hypothetical protein